MTGPRTTLGRVQYEVMVQGPHGEPVIYHAGDTDTEAVPEWVERARNETGQPYLGIALDGHQGHLLGLDSVEHARASGTLTDLAEQARRHTHRAAVRAVVRGLVDGKSLTVSEIGDRIDVATEDTRAAVHEEIRAGYADPVNEDWTRVKATPWVVPG